MCSTGLEGGRRECLGGGWYGYGHEVFAWRGGARTMAVEVIRSASCTVARTRAATRASIRHAHRSRARRSEYRSDLQCTIDGIGIVTVEGGGSPAWEGLGLRAIDRRAGTSPVCTANTLSFSAHAFRRKADFEPGEPAPTRMDGRYCADRCRSPPPSLQSLNQPRRLTSQLRSMIPMPPSDPDPIKSRHGAMVVGHLQGVLQGDSALRAPASTNS